MNLTEELANMISIQQRIPQMKNHIVVQRLHGQEYFQTENHLWQTNLKDLLWEVQKDLMKAMDLEKTEK